MIPAKLTGIGSFDFGEAEGSVLIYSVGGFGAAFALLSLASGKRIERPSALRIVSFPGKQCSKKFDDANQNRPESLG